MKTRPYAHQLREFEESKDLEARALLWRMRTGKTKVTIDTACHNWKAGRIDGVIVLAPNGVHANWVRRELPRHAWDDVPRRAHVWSSAAEHGRRADREAHADSLSALLSYRDGLAWLAVNSEALINERARKAIARFLRRRRVMLVVDESHDFRTPGSRRSKYARGLARHCAVRRILTGTAVSNTPLAAWAQFELLEKEALGFRRFTDFEPHFAEYEQAYGKGGKRYPTIKGYRNLDELRDRMARWSSVVLTEDVADMPDVVTTRRGVGVSDEARRIYERLRTELILDLEEGRVVDMVQGGKRLVKMQQALSGFLVADDGQVLSLGAENPRLDALVEEVRGTDGQSIVWCQFRQDIERVAAQLRAEGISLVEYHGGVRDRERQDAIDLFQLGLYQVFLGQPRAGGQGLDLSAARAIIWYSHTFDLIVRDQANERATQMGGRRIAVVDLAVPGADGDSVDEYILSSHEAKRSHADFVAGRGLRGLLDDLRGMGL